MKITIKAEAAAALNEIARFVETQNTPGSGKRFAIKFLRSWVETLTRYHRPRLCKYPEFADKGWKCFFYKNWVIAYAI